jgi:TolB-like protein/tetratricopeptide (TPR) repeat protein
MIHRFNDCELDIAKVELRANGVPVAVEPQVFALLKFLVENRARVVTKDDIIAGVWGGRIVSDAAIASRIKSARQAIGDDGSKQSTIRTVRNVGFSFVAEVDAPVAATASGEPQAQARADDGDSTRPSIAVLPFRLVGIADPRIPIADALPSDLIAELSRLRWLFVIARGSSFQFRGGGSQLDSIRERLGAQYCVSGVVEVLGNRMTVSVELSETRGGAVVWCEQFRCDREAVHDIRNEIVRAVAAAVEVRIPINEARHAALRSPENLDAWGAYHLGLQHMYRFNKNDNEAAANLFRLATELEPGFARAHAGLSFTCFQSAFLRYSNAADTSEAARRHAERCLERDPLDPFGHLTLGRAFWLDGDVAASLPWLERANALNPSYAQARYSLGWAEAILGTTEASRADADAALALSPLDPLVYGMLGVKALSYLAEQQPQSAAIWADRAANSPGAHALIAMIATASNHLAGDQNRAGVWAEKARSRASHLTRVDFQRAFPFRDENTRRDVEGALAHYAF